MGKVISIRSRSVGETASIIVMAAVMIPRWVIIAPLGLPVVPLV